METPTLQGIPEYADLMTIDQWKNCVACVALNQHDGDGCWATADSMDINSNVWGEPDPEWATHVAWFNQ